MRPYNYPRRGYRHKSIFASIDDCRCPLDRNQRAKLIALAEGLEARTRQPGRQNGSVSRIGLMILRALLYKFLSTRGQCFPSYSALATVTGLCRESIARAVSRLEQCGILKIIRRIVRKEVWDAERDRWFIGVVQTSNCYVFDKPSAGADHCAPPETGRGFPERRQGSLWDQAIQGLLNPSPRRRLESQSTNLPLSIHKQCTGPLQG